MSVFNGPVQRQKETLLNWIAKCKFYSPISIFIYCRSSAHLRSMRNSIKAGQTGRFKYQWYPYAKGVHTFKSAQITVADALVDGDIIQLKHAVSNRLASIGRQGLYAAEADLLLHQVLSL